MTFRIEPSTEISNRCDFSHLCNARGLVRAVEVGVAQGSFAAEFLNHWNQGELLWLVDDYASHDEFPGCRLPDMMLAVLAVHQWSSKVRFVVLDSLTAAEYLPEWAKPQFVYVDASHNYESVRQDLVAWWERLEPEGILAGHDLDETHPGVQGAVEWFAKSRDLVVRTTQDPPASWYIYKQEPEKLIHRFWRHGESNNAG